MRRTGPHRTMFVFFLIQWFLCFFTLHGNHRYPHGAWLASFSPVRSISVALESIFQTLKAVYKSSFVGVENHVEDNKETDEALSLQ